MELPGAQQLLATAIHLLIEGQQEDAARPHDLLFMGARAWSTLASAINRYTPVYPEPLVGVLAVLQTL